MGDALGAGSSAVRGAGGSIRSRLFAGRAWGAMLHLISMNLLYPKVVGSRVHLNPLVVTFSLMLWGFLWDAPGLLLAIPLTAALKAVCDNVRTLRPIGSSWGLIKFFDAETLRTRRSGRGEDKTSLVLSFLRAAFFLRLSALTNCRDPSATDVTEVSRPVSSPRSQMNSAACGAGAGHWQRHAQRFSGERRPQSASVRHPPARRCVHPNRPFQRYRGRSPSDIPLQNSNRRSSRS